MIGSTLGITIVTDVFGVQCLDDFSVVVDEVYNYYYVLIQFLLLNCMRRRLPNDCIVRSSVKKTYFTDNKV